MVAIRFCLCVRIAVGVPEENWTNHNAEYVALRVRQNLLGYVWCNQLPQLLFTLTIVRAYTPRENAGPGDTLGTKQVEHKKG